MMRKIIFSIGLILVVSYATAQIYENALPYSVSENLAGLTTYVKMESLDQEFLHNEALRQQSDGAKSSKFAKRIDVELNPSNSGEWIKTTKGRVWRLGIRSDQAYSLYMTFDKFYLRNGVKLFIYSPDYMELRGAYTSKNNNDHNILSIAPITGDVITVELNIPLGIEEYGELNISKIYHDFANKFGNRNLNALRVQDTYCEEDINCENGKYWQTEKRAVCKIISDGVLCTGTLIGNTSGSSEPYVLVPSHAIFDDLHAAESIFYFNYESLGCDKNVINNGKTLSGASLIASSVNMLDFSLLKLHVVPPASYHTYYVGWDATKDNPDEAVCIHHPLGYKKQIAFEYHPLTTATFGQNYDTLSSWRVAHWEIGTTQPGSSGAPLFNQKHKLVGTLTGGSSKCNNPVNDYFNKFCLAWDKYPEPINQLKPWLDPSGTGLTTIDGYDPYGFNMYNCDTAWNIDAGATLDLSNKGLYWGWISGQNSALYTKFAEKFISNTSIQIPGVYMNVAKAYHAQPLSYITMSVWEGNEIPADEKYSKMIFLKDLLENSVNYIDFDSVITVTGNFFVGYEVNYTTPIDSFAVYHSYNTSGSDISSMYVYDGTWQNINTVASIGMPASLAIGLMECYGIIQKPESYSLNIYPNPCTDYFFIDIPKGMSIYDIECFDMTGRLMPVTILYSEEKDKLNFQLQPGTYILKILTKEKQFFAKFIVID